MTLCTSDVDTGILIIHMHVQIEIENRLQYSKESLETILNHLSRKKEIAFFLQYFPN